MEAEEVIEVYGANRNFVRAMEGRGMLFSLINDRINDRVACIDDSLKCDWHRRGSVRFGNIRVGGYEAGIVIKGWSVIRDKAYADVELVYSVGTSKRFLGLIKEALGMSGLKFEKRN